MALLGSHATRASNTRNDRGNSVERACILFFNPNAKDLNVALTVLYILKYSELLNMAEMHSRPCQLNSFRIFHYINSKTYPYV